MLATQVGTERLKQAVSHDCATTTSDGNVPESLRGFHWLIERSAEELNDLEDFWQESLEETPYLICPTICSDGRSRSASYGFLPGAIRPFRSGCTLLDRDAYRTEMKQKIDEGKDRDKPVLNVECFHSDCRVLGDDLDYCLELMKEHEAVVMRDLAKEHGTGYLALYDDWFDEELTLFGPNHEDSRRTFTSEMAKDFFSKVVLCDTEDRTARDEAIIHLTEHTRALGLDEQIAAIAAAIMYDYICFAGTRVRQPEMNRHSESVLVIGRGMDWLCDNSSFVITADPTSPAMMEEALRTAHVGLDLMQDNARIPIVVSYQYNPVDTATREKAERRVEVIRGFLADRFARHPMGERVRLNPALFNTHTHRVEWLND